MSPAPREADLEARQPGRALDVMGCLGHDWTGDMDSVEFVRDHLVRPALKLPGHPQAGWMSGSSPQS